MKLIFLGLLLIFTSIGTHARWTPLAGTGNAVTYIDKSSIQHEGNTLKVWLLDNFATTGDQGQKSQMSIYEIDCKKELIRAHTTVKFSETMGKGNVITSINLTTDWGNVPPETVGDALLIATCTLPPNWNNKIEISRTISTAYFIDSTSIINLGSRFRFWQLQDLNTPDEQGARSRLIYLEFDCQKRTQRIFTLVTTSGNMGNGMVLLESNSPSWWQDIDDKSPQIATLNAICKPWILIDRSVVGDQYVSADAITKDGETRKVWELLSLAQGHRQPEFSFRTLREYDCKKHQQRALSATSYSAPMAQGKILETSKSSAAWTKLSPTGKLIAQRVCIN